jgi:cytidyltransferase-like protein
MSIVYTGGTFDMLHAGHIDLLEQCRQIATYSGKVVVSLNSDEFVASYKGSAPVCRYAERARVLMAIRYVDEVVMNVGGADSKPAIEFVDPDFIVIGSDWRDRDYHAQMGFTPAWLEEHMIQLRYVERERMLSSSEIKGRVQWGMVP